MIMVHSSQYDTPEKDLVNLNRLSWYTTGRKLPLCARAFFSEHFAIKEW
jgi:hypothetical protein